MASGRPTKAELDQRIDEIYGLLLSRVGYKNICRYASAKWQVTARQTDRYIAEARKLIRELLGPDQRDQLAVALGGYETIFTKQMAAGDWRGAAKTNRDIVALLGLAAPAHTRVAFSLEEINAQIDRLEAAVKAREEGL